MLDKTDDIAVAAESWLARFESALAGDDRALLKALFHPDSYWRDVLALSWKLQTLNGAEAILEELPALARSAGRISGSIRIERHRVASRAPEPIRSRQSSGSRPRPAAATASCG